MKRNLFLTLLAILFLTISSVPAQAIDASSAYPSLNMTMQTDGEPVSRSNARDPRLDGSTSTVNSPALDFSLAPDVSLSYQPQILETTVLSGTVATLPLTLTNSSAETALFELREDLGGWKSDLVPGKIQAVQHSNSRYL